MAVGTFLVLTLAALPVESQIISRIERTTRPGLLLTFLQPATPSAAQQGQKNVSVSLSGANTHFAQGTTIVDFGPGITLASPLTVTSPTTATVVLNVDPAAAFGYRNITMTTGVEVVTAANGFAVAYPNDSFGKTCAMAYNYNLGTLQPGMTKTAGGFLNLPGVEDWVAVSFGTGANLTVTLQGVQAPSNFDVIAYSSCGSTPIASTSSTAKSFVLPNSGPHSVILQIRATAWDVTKPMFTVWVSGN